MNVVFRVIWSDARRDFMVVSEVAKSCLPPRSESSSLVAAALIGFYAFGEPLGMAKLAAIGLICAGVAMLTLA